MKIAVVAPCPVPYTVGGAEKLWWGLVSHLNERTSHQADIIKLPSPEADLRSLLASYQQFSTLDLSGFDLIISGKYPAWIVSHPRHVCYMLHRLRGLYDAYPASSDLPYDLAIDPRVIALYGFLRRSRTSRSALPEFFERVREILARAGELPAVLDFPGPFARDLVHWLDGVALASESIERYAAISHTVTQRAGYFPVDVKVHVAWPPPNALQVRQASDDGYLFTVSRFDGPKRIGLIVEAMRHVKADIPLFIAGTGPEEAELHALAGNDARIKFLGFQNDADIRKLYAGARAVPFVPYQEDYGLIVVEAMQAGKPVVTTRDAGGPCELVVNGKTGLVCDADATALGAALDRLAGDPALARALGEAARERVGAITWENVVDTIVPAAMPVSGRRNVGNAKRLVVASTFGIFPPRHGGQSRIYNFYRNLVPEYETTIVAFGDAGTAPMDREIAPGVREIRIPKSPEHEEREREVAKQIGQPLTDVLMPALWRFTPAYGEALVRALDGANAAIASHPYLYPALKDRGLPVWYEAHNVEWKLKQNLLGESDAGKRLLAEVRAVESECSRSAEIVICSAPADAASLVSNYGVDPARIIDAPNGTDCSRIGFTGATMRESIKSRMGLAGQDIALFMGSGHWPNIAAVRRIFQFANALPKTAFAIVGSVCYAFAPPEKPPNVLFLGEVDEVTRNLALECCDVALNPMEHGSGTNLKMLDFFAAGIPVISSPTGARGLGVEDGRHCRVVEVDHFVPAIEALIASDATAREALTSEARKFVEENYDWERIAARVKHELQRRASVYVSFPVK
jgi:glycosyltransferase involved in cell wall biosynthesis